MRDRLIDYWYSPTLNFFTMLLLPFTFIFWLVIKLRRFFYKIKIFRQYHFSVPIIVVGNLTVGGTGKTPLVIYLANTLMKKGLRVGIIVRAYGVALKKSTEVLSDSSAFRVGDEAVLIKKNVECPVIAFHDRVCAVRTLLKNHVCDVVLSDDGLQHYALARTVEIAVIDGKRGFGNRYCLPAGPLREPVGRLKTVDFVVVNGLRNRHPGESGDPYKIVGSCFRRNDKRNKNDEHIHQMDLRVKGYFKQVQQDGAVLSINDFKGETVHAVAAIGHPGRFFDILRGLGLHVVEHTYPDHHLFSLKDIEFSDDKKVIMTEKDAVKCEAFASDKHWFLPVEANVPSVLIESLLNRVTTSRGFPLRQGYAEYESLGTASKGPRARSVNL
jgi:tetraacyldisaccharide 4'-kinase